MTQTRTIDAGGKEYKIVEWETIIASVVEAMRHNLSVFETNMTPTAEFQQMRMFFFRGARQSGKSTGITEYMRKNNQCMLFDDVTGSSYILNNGTAQGQLQIAGKNQTLKTAFEAACMGGVETFFVSSFSDNIIREMTDVYTSLKPIVPEKMIVVIEN